MPAGSPRFLQHLRKGMAVLRTQFGPSVPEQSLEVCFSFVDCNLDKSMEDDFLCISNNCIGVGYWVSLIEVTSQSLPEVPWMGCL